MPTSILDPNVSSGLPDRAWLITGTSSGFGRALVHGAIARGDRVMATARDLSQIEDLASLAPERVRTARLDVTDTASVRAAVAAAEAAFGGIDVLVNNAGYGLLGAFEEHTDQELRASFETNLFGALSVSRAVLPGMRRRRSGHLVQMSSVIGVISGLGGSGYAGPKAALESMTEALAAEVAHLGIRVTIVEPGPFRTDFGGRSLHWGHSLEDYAEVIAPARRAFETAHGSQTGDPRRGAEAIVAAVHLPNPPLRLPLGAEAYAWIGSYLRARIDQLHDAAPLGADTAWTRSPSAS
jgi:NAD(P)-dependent dehydrogenase (short-subunit alcohol dehydrogenase family)